MRRAAPTSLITALGALALAVPAAAQDPLPQPAPAPAPTPPPESKPSSGRMKLSMVGGIRSEGRAYFLTGNNAAVVGTVKPFVAGETVRVRISTPKRKPTVVTTRIRKAKGGGAFKVRFKIRRGVTYSIFAVHEGTDKQAAFSAKAAAHGVQPSTRSRMGVALFKQGLRALGYPAGNGPHWNDRVARSVMAFRKTNSMARTFSPNRRIFEMVFEGRGGYKLRYPRAGKHVEADLSRQVLVLAQGGKAVSIYHTSSGTSATPTILGRYRFYLKGPGTNAKRMYMSNFFIRGYAIHGYPSVPTYPASHGCLRVPNADAVTIYNWIRLGDPIYVYR